MSMINKLSIRGIRSFGNELADEQKIQFSHPLTLIVGENGCGKTTIIESLKYALTGDCPPGTDKGKTFVHDPKVFRTSTSLGQVKLMVTDNKGDSVTCVRSMKTELKKTGKVKFETLDSVLLYESKTGKREENGRRVDEVNKEMCAAMGVSKAILNNVIFCHQEDSNWPLDEGKKLKEKFDAIFGTTAYDKAIEKVIKIRKNYTTKLTTCKEQKRHLEALKKDADRKSTELDLLKSKHQKMIATINVLDESLKPIEEKLEALKVIEAKFGKMQGQKFVFESTIKNCESNAENYRKKIKELLDNSVGELENQLDLFEETKEENALKLSAMNEKQKKMVGEENQLRETTAKMNATSETLINRIGQMQDLMGKRVEFMQKLCQNLEITIKADLDDDKDSETLIKLFGQIQEAIARKERCLEKIKKETESEDLEAQQKIDKVREQKIVSETNLEAQRNRIKAINESKTKMERDITAIETSMPKFNKLLEEINSSVKSLEKVKSESNVDDLEEEMILVETEKLQIDDEIKKNEELVERLESISDVINEIKVKEEALLEEKADFNRIKNRSSPTLKTLFASQVIERNYKSVVQSLSDKLEIEVKKIKDTIQEATAERYRFQTKYENLSSQLKQKETELSEIKEKIYRICDGRDYMDLFRSQREKVDKLNMELAFHKSSESSLKHYIEDIQQDPCCPLCHENLRNQGEDLKEEIDEKIRLLPSRISEVEKKLKAENAKFYQINEMKSYFDNVPKLENEAKSLEKEKKRVDTDYQKNIADIEGFEMLVAEPDLKLKMITQTFYTDMVRLDDLTKSIASKAKVVNDLRNQLPTEMPEKNLQEAKNELRQMRKRVKSKTDLSSSISKRIHETRSKINSMQDYLNEMVSQKMANQEKVHGLGRIKNQLDELNREKADLERKMKEDEHKMTPINEKFEFLIANKLQKKIEANKQVQNVQKEINNYQTSLSELVRLNNDIASLENENLQKTYERVMKVISDSKDRISQLKKKMEQTLCEILKLNEDVVNHESKQRNLQDNMELRKIEIEKKLAEEGLRGLLQTMGDMNPKKLGQETKFLREDRDRINGERQSIRGRVTESGDRIASAQNEINEPRYANAKINFMKECYRESVLKELIDDLHKHRAALERSLLKFHAEKMSQINQIIRELWNNIYKGNDIDYIMIKTDEEEGPKAVSVKKRCYNYRVVQAKNGGAEIDMRGRCSAGQKVLASLIIRMALADTFSANCGILALDEPTTNLDHNNIHSLCNALKKIVEEREKMGNFMLVIITHDEEFVSAMERSEHHYKLSRDSKGRSRIDKIQNM